MSDEEQPDRADLGQQPTLRTYPTLHPNERQLPAGDGLPPPSQPEFPGMEADLPWIGEVDLFDEETGELAPDAPFVVTAMDVWTSGIDENDPAVSISPIERVKLARLRARGYDKALLVIA